MASSSDKFLCHDEIKNNISLEQIKKSYSAQIMDKVTSVKTFAHNDKSDRPRHIKEAEGCFAFAGVDPYEKCPHGLLYFQCMPCSH